MGQKAAYRKKEGQERFDNRIALLVSDGQREWLAQEARRHEITINELIRALIENKRRDNAILERGSK